MSQKFILIEDKTPKKISIFTEDKTRKFTRKRSERDRSSDSIKSKEHSISSVYIKQPDNPNYVRFSRGQEEASLIFKRMTSSIILDEDPQQRQERRFAINRKSTSRDKGRDEKSLMLRIQTLQAELELKHHEFDVLTAECNRYKSQLDEEKERRRKLELEKRNLTKTVQQLQKSLGQVTVQNKSMGKERQFLMRQVQFLQKINYDEEIRTIQSFRQQYMEEQLLRLREQIKLSKTSREKYLELQIEELRGHVQTSQQSFRALNSLVSVLQCKIDKLGVEIQLQKKITRERVLSSNEYKQLKDKYKRFLEQYKQIRTQNWNLKCLYDQKETELLLSQSQSQMN